MSGQPYRPGVSSSRGGGNSGHAPAAQQQQQQQQVRPQCQFTPPLRHACYATYSRFDTFMAATGGDAPWYSHTRHHAMSSSKGFFSRFVASVGTYMGLYATERAAWEQRQQAKQNKESEDNGEDDPAPELPSELQRMSAYVAVEYSKRHLFSASGAEIARELRDLAASPAVRDNPRIALLFRALDMAAVNSAAAPAPAASTAANAAPPKQDSVAAAATTAPSAAGEEQFAHIKSSAMRAIAIERWRKEQQQQALKAKSAAAHQQGAAAAAAAAAASADSAVGHKLAAQPLSFVPASGRNSSTSEDEFADGVIAGLIDELVGCGGGWLPAVVVVPAEPAAAADDSASVPSAATTTTTTTVAVPLSNLLQRVQMDVAQYVQGNEKFVQDELSPAAAAEAFWTFLRRDRRGDASSPASSPTVAAAAAAPKRKRAQPAAAKDGGSDGEKEDDGDKEDGDDDNDDDAGADSAGGWNPDGDTLRGTPPGSRTAAEIAAADLAAGWAADVPRGVHGWGKAFASREVTVPRIAPALVELSERAPLSISAGSAAPSSPSTASADRAAATAARRRYECVNAVVHGLLATNRRQSGMRFSAQCLDPRLFIDHWAAQSAAADASDAEQKHRAYLTEAVQPFVQREAEWMQQGRGGKPAAAAAAPARGGKGAGASSSSSQPPRLFLDTATAAAVGTAKGGYVPNIHSKVVAETGRAAVKRREWERLLTFAVATAQLAVLAARDAHRVLAAFHNLTLRARVLSGQIINSVTAYAHDVDHGNAARIVGAEAEEEATANADLLHGVASSLLRLYPAHAAWLGHAAVLQWVRHCWGRWTALEAEVRAERNKARGAGRLNGALLHSQRRRFVDLALELHAEAERRQQQAGGAGGKPQPQQAQQQPLLQVWVPLTNVGVFVFDGRENMSGMKKKPQQQPPQQDSAPVPAEFCFDAASAKNTARVFTVNELDICVCNLTPCLDAIKANRLAQQQQPDAALLVQPPVAVDFVLEVKLAPTDVVKAQSQDVVFSRCLASHVEWAQKRRPIERRLNDSVMAATSAGAAAAAASSSSSSPGDGVVPVFYRAYMGVPEDDCAFVGEAVPSNNSSPDEVPLPFAPGGCSAAAVGRAAQTLNALVDRPPLPRLSKQQLQLLPQEPVLYVTVDSFAAFAREEHQRFYVHNGCSVDNMQPATLAALRSSSQLPTPPLQPTPKWTAQQHQQQQAAGGVPAQMPPPSCRFVIVTKHVEAALSPEDASKAKFFPVLAQLKHAVVRNVAGLLAGGAWRGFQPRPADVQRLVAARAAELLQQSSLSAATAQKQTAPPLLAFLPLERAVRAAVHGIMERPPANKKEERAAKFAPLGAELHAVGKDISRALIAPVTAAELLSNVTHADFVNAVASINSLWLKEQKKKSLKTPADIFWDEYVVRDNVLFVRFAADTK